MLDMRNIILLLSLFLFSGCSHLINCYQFIGKEETRPKSNKKFEHNPYEDINMGGYSAVSEYEFINKLNNSNSPCTRYPRERTSRYNYQNCKIYLVLNSNNDTGNDRLRIMVDTNIIYQTEMTSEDRKVKLRFYLDTHRKIKFLVDNQSTNLHTPGAFETRIRIKEIQ